MADDSKLPKSAGPVIAVILAVMALLSIYGNIQRWRRGKVEKVIVTPIATATPSISPAP